MWTPSNTIYVIHPLHIQTHPHPFVSIVAPIKLSLSHTHIQTNTTHTRAHCILYNTHKYTRNAKSQKPSQRDWMNSIFCLFYPCLVQCLCRRPLMLSNIHDFSFCWLAIKRSIQSSNADNIVETVDKKTWRKKKIYKRKTENYTVTICVSLGDGDFSFCQQKSDVFSFAFHPPQITSISAARSRRTYRKRLWCHQFTTMKAYGEKKFTNFSTFLPRPFGH